jgi:hypothetical protein
MVENEFIYDFVDKEGRPIQIQIDEHTSEISAHHNGKKVGYLDIELKDEGPHACAAEIDKEFQKAGIGLELVRHAFEYNGQKLIPPKTYDPKKENSMSPAGLALMLAGQRKGWVGQFPDHEEPDDDEF